MLTGKDYKLVAAVLNAEVSTFRAYGDKRDMNAGNAIDRITGHLADYMAADNPNFDRDKFLEACYIKGTAAFQETPDEWAADRRDQDGGCPWCGRDCPDAGKPEGCWYQGCPDFPHGE
jgi:hypothetical protein